eukprot:14281-Heterococcus_DN1.PRE.1
MLYIPPDEVKHYPMYTNTTTQTSCTQGLDSTDYDAAVLACSAVWASSSASHLAIICLTV